MISEIIAKKRDGLSLTRNEIEKIVLGFTNDEIPVEQVSAWLMAVLLKGMDSKETFNLTQVILSSGDNIDLSDVPGPHLDKHSTGGVGDKTSLVVVPMLASCGVTVMKMSGRGLGFSGGTLDKLESIPGFRTELSQKEIISQLKSVRACLVGQSASLAPADKKLYALRDVTATVPSIPLIVSSILSKKLAGGAGVIMFDVKTGSGSFMGSLARSKELAETLIAVGKQAGKKMGAIISDMDQPLGDTVGNALEMREAIQTLTPGAKKNERFLLLCLTLCKQGLLLSGLIQKDAEAEKCALDSLARGAALAKLREIIEAQGGDAACVDNPEKLKLAPHVLEVKSSEEGYVAAVDAKPIGLASVELGAGRKAQNDKIDHGVGFIIHKHIGDKVAIGDVLATIYAQNEAKAALGEMAILGAYRISETPVKAPKLIYETIF